MNERHRQNTAQYNIELQERERIRDQENKLKTFVLAKYTDRSELEEQAKKKEGIAYKKSPAAEAANQESARPARRLLAAVWSTAAQRHSLGLGALFGSALGAERGKGKQGSDSYVHLWLLKSCCVCPFPCRLWLPYLISRRYCIYSDPSSPSPPFIGRGSSSRDTRGSASLSFPPALKTAQRMKRSQGESFESREVTYKRLLELAENGNIDQLVDGFIEKEGKNFAYFSYATELNSEMEKLQQRIKNLQVCCSPAPRLSIPTAENTSGSGLFFPPPCAQHCSYTRF